MNKTIIDELLEFQKSVTKPEWQSRLERCKVIWRIAEILSVTLPSNCKSEILSRLDAVIGNLEWWQINKVSSEIKILIADILEVLPRETRNWEIKNSTSYGNFEIKTRTRPSISYWESSSESSSESNTCGRSRNRSYSYSWESSSSRWES